MTHGIAWTPVRRHAIHRGLRPVAEPEDVARATPDEFAEAESYTQDGLIVATPSVVAVGARGLTLDNLVLWVAGPGGTGHALLFRLLQSALFVHGGDQLVGGLGRDAALAAVVSAHGAGVGAAVSVLAQDQADIVVLTMTRRIVVAFVYRAESSAAPKILVHRVRARA